MLESDTDSLPAIHVCLRMLDTLANEGGQIMYVHRGYSIPPRTWSISVTSGLPHAALLTC